MDTLAEKLDQLPDTVDAIVRTQEDPADSQEICRFKGFLFLR